MENGSLPPPCYFPHGMDLGQKGRGGREVAETLAAQPFVFPPPGHEVGEGRGMFPTCSPFRGQVGHRRPPGFWVGGSGICSCTHWLPHLALASQSRGC